MLANFLSCKNLNTWRDLLLDAPKNFGFSHVMFNMNMNSLSLQFQTVIFANQPLEWQEKYRNQEFSSNDPFINHCRRCYIPLVWSEKYFSSPKQKVYYEEADRLGIRSGVCLPIRGADGETGMLNFTSEDAEVETGDDAQAVIGDLTVFRDYLLEAYFQLRDEETNGPPVPKLTPRELECLRWIALGKTSWEASRIMRCAEVTVNYHVRNIMQKFNAQSRQHAIIRGLQAGIISL